MRKSLCVGMVFLFLFVFLSGCGGQTPSSVPDPNILLNEGTVLSQTQEDSSTQGSGETPPATESIDLASSGAGSSSQAASSQASQNSSSQGGSSQISSTASSTVSSSQPTTGSGGSSSAEEYRAVWFSYLDISGMLKGQSQSSFRQSIGAAFKKVSDLGCNVVILQVRPFGDALYDSDYFPWSYLCTGTEGRSPGYDPLQVMIEQAKNLGLEVEAWINPYRIRTSGNGNALASSNIASKWESEEEDYVIRYGGGLYYNPARPAVRELIVNGVKELVQNYEIDGIHFDDYFYPSPDNSFDATAYQEYKNGGGSLSLANWRRENVNILIRDVYSAVKAINSGVRFGVSPQGNNSNNYNSQYIDVDKWLSNKGYVDYICPQIYFGFNNSSSPYDATVSLWNSKIKVSGISLYIGLAPYKIGQVDSWAGNGKNEWINDSSILARQVQTARNYNKCGGFALFRYASLFTPDSSVKSQVEKERQALADVL